MLMVSFLSVLHSDWEVLDPKGLVSVPRLPDFGQRAHPSYDHDGSCSSALDTVSDVALSV